MPKGKLHEGQHRATLEVKEGGFALGSLVATHAGQVEEQFTLEGKVGEGGFGAVRKARCKDTGAWRAVKSIARSAVPDMELLREEINIMRLVDHPHIVRLSETFEDSCWVYLVMELCEGGELFQQISQAQVFSEPVTAAYTRQMLLAVNYLHQNRIMHRDLKPENFLFGAKLDQVSMEKATLKLIDFGFSKRLSFNEHCETLCGTLLYIAPEVLEERYAFKADVWSLGVMLYLMLSGRLPWGNLRNDDLLMKAVKEGNILTDGGAWRSISDDAKNLVHHLLTKDPEVRPQAVQALEHKWLAEAPKQRVRTSLTAGDVGQLKAFGQMNNLKKAATDVLVTQLPESEIQELKALFMDMDTNKDGTVSLAELKKALGMSGVQLPDNIAELMTECDLDGSGVLDYTEFLGAVMDRKQYHQKDILWAAFKRFDCDNSGFIDRKELHKVLNEEVRESMGLGGKISNVDKILAEVDKDNNGQIDFEEFFEMMVSVGQDKSVTKQVSSKSAALRKRMLKTGRTLMVVASIAGEN